MVLIREGLKSVLGLSFSWSMENCVFIEGWLRLQCLVCGAYFTSVGLTRTLSMYTRISCGENPYSPGDPEVCAVA